MINGCNKIDEKTVRHNTLYKENIRRKETSSKNQVKCCRIPSCICMLPHLETLVTYIGRFFTGADIFATDNQHIFYNSTVTCTFYKYIGRFATQHLLRSQTPT